MPDQVFQKGSEVAVWDAKYKRMRGMKRDVDRADFFQIHTYIQHFAQHKTVKAGGLLYPITCDPNFEEYSSPYLLHEEGKKMNFSIEGIKLREDGENGNAELEQRAFVKRILIGTAAARMK